MPPSASLLPKESHTSPPQVRADYLAEAQATKTFREGFLIRTSVFITQHNQMAAKRLLHVPERITDARLPIEPSSGKKLTKQPGVDVVTHVDD